MIRTLVATCSIALATIWFAPTNAVTVQTATPKFSHPWAAACKVTVNLRAGLANGGSGTLIGVTENEALVLTVSHVAERVGQTATCQFSDQKVHGYVLATHPTADLALILIERPDGVNPVVVANANRDSGPFYLVGYPGYDRDTMRYQIGEYVDHDKETLVVTSRPEKGQSGGPAFNRYGQVVGAISAYGPRYGYVADGAALRELVGPYLVK